MKSPVFGYSKKVAVTQEIISPSFSNSFSFIGKTVSGFLLLTIMALVGSVNAFGQATETFGCFLTNTRVNPCARQRSLRVGSIHSIFFPRLSISTWKTMVELRKFYDAFFDCISRISEGFNFRAEKKDQFMLLKDYTLSNSKFHQVLLHGDLTLSN